MVRKYCSKTHGLAKHCSQCVKVYSGLDVLSSGMLTSVVGLDGPVIGIGLPKDFAVLEAGTDGLVSIGEWSWKELIPMGILLCLCEGIFLRVVGMLWTCELVSGTACGVSMSMPIPAVGDSLCWCDESAMTSAGEPSVVLVSTEVLPLVSSVLHSLLLGKGKDRLLQMIICGLPCSWLRAASL